MLRNGEESEKLYHVFGHACQCLLKGLNFLSHFFIGVHEGPDVIQWNNLTMKWSDAIVEREGEIGVFTNRTREWTQRDVVNTLTSAWAWRGCQNSNDRSQ